MSHEITIREGGFAEMAYVGQTPWHGLGQSLDPDATIDEWRICAGLNWEINRSPVQFMNGSMHQWKEQEVLYRSDSNAPLSVVTNRYQVVQPGEVLEFFRDLVEADGFKIDTAGTLKGGRRIWALARTGFDGDVVPGDNVKTYLLLVTSCDGGLATTAQFTSVRVVCQNTLQMSLTRDNTNAGKIKVRHNTMFNPENVKGQLGLNAKAVYGDFMLRMRNLADTTVSGYMAQEMIEALMASQGFDGGKKGIRESKGFKTIINLFNGQGIAANMDGVAGTAWGVMNAVTEYVDHRARAKSMDNRLNNAWFGSGAQMKESALELAEHF